MLLKARGYFAAVKLSHSGEDQYTALGEASAEKKKKVGKHAPSVILSLTVAKCCDRHWLISLAGPRFSSERSHSCNRGLEKLGEKINRSPGESI